MIRSFLFAGTPILLGLAAPSSFARQIDLLADLDPTFKTAGPFGLVDSGAKFARDFAGGALFVATSASYGQEAWFTDGTAAGTRMLTDSVIGKEGSSLGSVAALPGGDLLFTQDSSLYGVELFRLDANTLEVELFLDLVPGPLDSDPNRFVEWNGEVWFFADDGVNGTEIWKTDGTPAGTQLALELVPGPGDAFNGTNVFVATATHLFFSNGGQNELFALDSPTGTPTFLARYDGYPIAVGGDLYFESFDLATGSEVWKSDGTPAGTQIVADINPGPDDSSPRLITGDGARLWFSAAVVGQGRELYVTDGTQAGTLAIPEVQPGIQSGISVVPKVYPASGGAFFLGMPTTTSHALYFTDGTSPSLVKLLDLDTSSVNGFVSGGSLYFRYQPGGDDQLYVSDGTLAGTALYADLSALGSSFDVQGVSALGVFMNITTPSFGEEPFLFDVATATATFLGDLAPAQTPKSTSLSTGVALLGRHHFTAPGFTGSANAWSTDGTALGTGPESLGLTTSIDDYTPHLSLGERLVYSAGLGSGPLRVHASAAGVTGFGAPVDLLPFLNQPLVQESVQDGELGYLLVRAEVPAVEQIYVTDGTQGGTATYGRSFATGPGLGLRDLTPFAGRVYFVNELGSSSFGPELWSTDGTVAGTQVAADLWPGSTGSAPRDLTVVGDRLFFVATTPAEGTELFQVDANGAVSIVADLAAGSAGSEPRHLLPLDGKLFFAADDGLVGEEPWITDGQPGGTALLADLASNSGPSFVSRATVAGDRVFLLAREGGDQKLWATSNVPGTAVLVADENAPGDDLELQPIDALGSGAQVVLRSYQPATGLELWTASDQPGSLRLAYDLNPGPASSSPVVLGRAGGSLLLSADDGATGTELHGASIVGLGGVVAETYGTPCGSDSIGVVGEPRLGSSFDVTLDTAPGAFASLFVATDLGYFPVSPDCASWITVAPTPILVGASAASGSGEAALTLPIANQPAWLGLPLYFQWVSVQAGGPLYGIGDVSDGLEVWLGS